MSLLASFLPPLALGLLSLYLYIRLRQTRQAAHAHLSSAHALELVTLHEPTTFKLLYVSPACLALAGYSPHELRGRPLGDLVHPQDWNLWPAQAELRNPPPLRWRMLRKDSGWIWVESAWLPAPRGTQGQLLVTRDIGEKLRGEAALRESERRYHMICDQIADIVWVYDVEKRAYSYLSPSVERVLGYTPAQLLEHSPAAWMESDALMGFSQRLAQRLESYQFHGEEKEPVGAEFPAKRADGSSVWLECRSTLARSSSGRLEITGTLRDITSKKRSEDALLKREEELRANNRIFMALLDAVQTRVFWKDKSGRYQGCNRLYALDAGFSSPKELLGKTDLELGWHGRGQEITEQDRLVLENGMTQSGDISEQPLFDGSVRYVLSHKAPLRESDGSISGLLGTYSDITPLVLAERSLRESEKRYRLMVDHQSDLVVKMDLEGHILHASPSYCQLFSAPLDEIMGRSFLPRLGLTARSEAEDALRRIQFPPYTANLEIHHLLEGRERCIAWSFRGIPGEDGLRIVKAVGSGRDVTEQKKMVEERERLLKQMENKNSELERIANLVTHDVKSALFNMAGFASELKEDLGRGFLRDAHADAEQILKAGDRLGHLLEAEIRISRLSEQYSGQWFDIGALVGEVLRDRRQEFTHAGMEVRQHTSAPQAWGDPSKVACALHHLLDNAIKFRNPHGPHQLTVALERSTSPSGHGEVCLTVQDSGLGIAEDFLPQLFELFNKADSGTPGLGEGLASVRRIAELHGGRAWAYSEGPGQGCSVSFTLPEPADRPF